MHWMYPDFSYSLCILQNILLNRQQFKISDFLVWRISEHYFCTYLLKKSFKFRLFGVDNQLSNQWYSPLLFSWFSWTSEVSDVILVLICKISSKYKASKNREFFSWIFFFYYKIEFFISVIVIVYCSLQIPSKLNLLL